MIAIYHVFNRGVDKRLIFLDRWDYLRFIHNLYEFNDQNPADHIGYNFKKSANLSADLRSRQPKEKIVDIYAFSLMPNHYHLFLSPLVEGGITKFMRKLNIGYSKYFNQKNNRTGALFEGRYKSITVMNDSHFLHLPFYIHCNPLDLVDQGWRTGQLKDYNRAIKFLENYRWSSHLDYLGIKNFPSVINKNMLLDVFGDENKYRNDIYDWLKNQGLSTNINNIKPFLLE